MIRNHVDPDDLFVTAMVFLAESYAVLFVLLIGEVVGDLSLAVTLVIGFGVTTLMMLAVLTTLLLNHDDRLRGIERMWSR